MNCRLVEDDFIKYTDNDLLFTPQWINWLDDFGPEYNILPEMDYLNIDIPTIDNVRNAAIIEFLLVNCLNVLCVGSTGSGKTLTISKKLSTKMPKEFITDLIIFSARTSANKIQVN